MVPRIGRRMLSGGVVALAAALATAGVAQAGVDSVNGITDSGNTIEVTQLDTFINGVAPLDGSPLTREWFHNGRASVAVTGPSAVDFDGIVSAGYQIAYPMSLGGSVTFEFETPEATVTIDSAVKPKVVISAPTVGFNAAIAPGPGVTEVEVASGSASGELTEIQFANVHGTATGILGNVTVRPYVKAVSSSGSTVVSYGAPWRLN
ncbi:MspA family porin [Rhodococcus sp. B10]|uniref:MspA family porin n=1 Tax=Rhodococcus sp. B10 TaxID=2695876 RepID=UPI00168F7279|nr:MspA family porin [Rhodococcus sp. B10]NIL78668.1 Porin MspA [Rhodococcus sp. B10]